MRTYENTIALSSVYRLRLYACIYAVLYPVNGLPKTSNNTRYEKKNPDPVYIFIAAGFMPERPLKGYYIPRYYYHMNKY